jgi:hypothetical protein
MNFFRNRQRKTDARRFRQAALHLEALENRTVPTVFSVTQVPSTFSLEQATADVQVGQDQGPVADVSVMAAAHPVGMGYQSGYFSIDGEPDNALEIDTAPDAGQQLGDPIQIAFSYSWTATLQTYEGSDTPPWESYVNSSVAVAAGTYYNQLFNDSISTNFILADQHGGKDQLIIPMTVGDSVFVSVSLDGVAHCAEPHYQTWVDFQAEFTVQDASERPLPHQPLNPATPAAVSLATDAVFALQGAELSHLPRGTEKPAATARQAEEGTRSLALRSFQDADASISPIVKIGASPKHTQTVPEGQLSDRLALSTFDVEAVNLMIVAV